MGREWYFGNGGGEKSTKREGKRGDRESSSSSNSSSTTTPGCMTAVFHFFDFHPCFNQHHPSFQPHPAFLHHEPPIILKGVEAPRNSLESDEVFMAVDASFSPAMGKAQDNLNIPMSIQIKTTIDGSSSESSYSPSTKTPNLVARLMGLDLLPLDSHSNSPTSSSAAAASNHNPLRKSQHLHHHQQTSRSSRRTYSENDIMRGTRSLPETPRVSSERKSDVDYYHHHQQHRLSLQIIREKVMENDENNNRSSPRSHYAKQIVKQVRESVIGRKVGLDITNTIKNNNNNNNNNNNRSGDQERRDEHLLGIKVKKSSKNLVKVVIGDDELSPTKHSTTPNSCSPRLRFLELKNKSITSTLSSSSSPLSSISTLDNQSNHLAKVSLRTKQQYPQSHQKCIRKSKKVTGGGEMFKSCHFEKPIQNLETMSNKKEEHFVRPSTASRANNKHSDKKCIKTPLSNDLLNDHVQVQTLHPVKKNPSPPATKLPQKQVAANVAHGSKRGSRLSSNSCITTFKQEATHTSTARESKDNICARRLEFEYVTKILRRTGIEKDTQVSFARWFSPSHPLDPSIFNQLESTIVFATTTTTTTTTTVADWLSQLGNRCNRRLIFHLVDEILIDILRPYINMKPWVVRGTSMHHDHDMKGSHLIEKLCARIRSYPMSKCEDLQDIDALVGRDLHEPPPPPASKSSSSTIEFEEEGESVVLDIEKDIMDSLVHETVVALWWL